MTPCRSDRFDQQAELSYNYFAEDLLNEKKVCKSDFPGFV